MIGSAGAAQMEEVASHRLGDQDLFVDVQTGPQYWTPLMAAVVSGRLSMVVRLLGQGARMDLLGAEGETALHLAVVSEMSDAYTLQWEGA